MRRAAALVLVTLLAACQTADLALGPSPQAAAPDAAAAPVPAFSGSQRPRAVAERDDAAKAQLVRRLADLDRRAYRGVTVEVWGGRALLMGAVIKPEQRRKAEKTAAATPGVTAVHNELVLAEDRALDLFAADPAREAAVRRAVGADGRGDMVVRVINGVAFLLGTASDAGTAAALRADATEVAGIKWVVAHLATP